MREPKEIFVCESLLPKLVTPNITHYYCISSKYSAIEQSNNIRKLFEQLNISNLNTFIEIVDFGGDILTNGEQSSIISPELDAFSLAIVRNLSEYKSHIAVCFLGVDGELNKSYLRNMCNFKSSHNEIIDHKLWLSQLNTIYQTLKKFRSGNTIPNMINVLNVLGNNDTIDCKILKSFTVGKNKYKYNKNIDIDISLQSNIYFFDINIDNPFVDIFNTKDYNLLSLLNNLLQIYKKQIVDDDIVQQSDLYLQYLRKDSNNLYTNKELTFNDDIIFGKEINLSTGKNEGILFVDIIPFGINNEKEEILKSINYLETYNIKLSSIC